MVANPAEEVCPVRRRTAAHPFFYVACAIVAALIIFLFGAVLADMAHDWWIEPAWSQGLLLPPLALYIAWLRRDVTLSHPAVQNNAGLLVTGFSCITFLLGKLASEFFLMRIAFVLLLVGLIWTFWGLARLRTLTFPLLLLAAMVPLPVMVYNSLAAPLQLLASDMATRIIQALGTSVFRDGNVLHLANLSLGVEEACSGLNSLSALMVGGMLLGYLLCSRLPARLLLFAVAVPLAIAVNIVRIAGTAVLADYNQDFAMGFYHAFSGWLVFVAGFGILYLLARFLHAFAD
jgi:exosortase